MADAEREMNAFSERQKKDINQDAKIDEASNDKIQKLWAEAQEKKDAERKKAAAVAAVPVEKDNIQLVATSLSISEEDAKLALQKKKGDAVAVLREAVGLPVATKAA